MWHIKLKNGNFVYSNDPHPCHLTWASEVSLLWLVRHSRKAYEWKEFDAFEPIATGNIKNCMILKCADVPDMSCYMIEHFLKKVRVEREDEDLY